MKRKLYNFTHTSFLKSKIYTPNTINDLYKHTKTKHTIVGNRRSYGDSFIGKKKIISLKNFNKILNINYKNKTVKVEGGTLLYNLFKSTLNKNLILTCAPGCKYVSVGGMIANNVSGKLTRKNLIKNYIKSIKVLANNKKIIDCSKYKNKQFFNLTVGGKGRTGPIISAELYLEKINSNKILQKALHFSNYKEFFFQLSKIKNYKYSFCWIDFTKKNLSGIIFVGSHIGNKNIIKFKFNDYKLPETLMKNLDFFLNNRLFTILFNKIFKYKYLIFNNKITDINSFYFPQNKLLNWNDLFKKRGFVQFNFFFKKKNLKKIVESLKEELRSNNLYSNFVVIKFHSNNAQFAENLSMSIDMPIKKNIKKIQEIVSYAVNKFNLDVNLSKDMVLKKLNKKTLKSNQIFNPKMSKYFMKNYISNLFDRIKIQ